MKLISLAVITLLLINKILSLSTNDLCIRIQDKCTGNYDSNHNYDVTCVKTKCEGKLSYRCGQDYCATNKKSCDTVFNLMFLLRSYKGLLLFEKELDKYSDFIQKIKECPSEAYLFQEEDVCSNGIGCYSKAGFSFRIGKNKVIKPVNCPCMKEHSFQCGDDFCAIHSNACDEFRQNSSNLMAKKCGNDNQILRKKFLFY